MILLAYMMLIHFVADFLLQSREMGKNKSIYFKVLLQHVGIQFGMFALFLSPFLGIKLAIAFAALNGLVHGVIDWYIWKGYKLYAFKTIVKEIRQEIVEKFGDPSWVDDKSLVEVIAPERFKEKVAGWKFWEDHWFFATIGLDQLLHTLTIILVYSILL